jgi:hypothetical protein
LEAAPVGPYKAGKEYMLIYQERISNIKSLAADLGQMRCRLRDLKVDDGWNHIDSIITSCKKTIESIKLEMEPEAYDTFSRSNLHRPDGSGDNWSFIASISPVLRELGIDIEDNYEAHEYLVKKKVVKAKANYDHEMCCCYYYFSAEKAAVNFFNRLNEHCRVLRKQGKKERW